MKYKLLSGQEGFFLNKDANECNATQFLSLELVILQLLQLLHCWPTFIRPLECMDSAAAETLFLFVQ